MKFNFMQSPQDSDDNDNDSDQAISDDGNSLDSYGSENSIKVV